MAGVQGNTDVDRSGMVQPNMPIRTTETESTEKIAPGMLGAQNLIQGEKAGTIDTGSGHIILPRLNAPEGKNIEHMGQANQEIAQIQQQVGSAQDRQNMEQVITNRLGRADSSAAYQVPYPQMQSYESRDHAVSIQMGDGSVTDVDFAQGSVRVGNAGGQSVVFDMSSGSMLLDNGEKISMNKNDVRDIFDFFQLLKVFHDMAVGQRKVMREGRAAANEMVVTAIQNQADLQKKAATQRFLQGFASAAGKMASAGLSAAGSVKGMRADRAAMNNNLPPQQFQGQMISARFQAYGQMTGGSFDMVSAGFGYQAAQLDAQQTMMRKEEEAARNLKQTEQDQMGVAHDFLTKLRETYQQMYQNTIQTLTDVGKNI